MTVRLAIPEDNIAERLLAATGVAFPAPDAKDNRVIVVVDDTDPSAVMITEKSDIQAVWIVQHVWGASAAAWLGMIRVTAQELLARGEGAVPVRWPPLTSRPALNVAVRALRTRTTVSSDSGRHMWEITANEALALLGSL